MTNNCSACGALNVEDAVFCTTCGAMPETHRAPSSTINPPPRAALAKPVLLRYDKEAGGGGQLPPPPPVHTVSAAVSTTPSVHGAAPAPTRAGAFERWLAWALDVLITIPISLVAIIPLLGGVLAAITGMGYLLLRDQSGASIGKRALGLRVIGSDGRPASRNALTMRNLPLALPYLLCCIPFLGIFMTFAILLPVMLIEAMSVLFTGSRVGDKLAGTMVVKQ